MAIETPNVPLHEATVEQLFLEFGSRIEGLVRRAGLEGDPDLQAEMIRVVEFASGLSAMFHVLEAAAARA